MSTTLNRAVFDAFAAPADLDGIGLVASIVVAQWLVALGPATLALLWVFGMHQERRCAVAAGAGAALSLGVAHLVSAVVWEPRPFMDAGARNYLHHVADSGFPSDHCSMLFALSFALLVFRPARVPWLWAAFLALSLAVGWARVFLGAHYPVDVAGAAGISAVSAAVLATSWGRRATRAATGLAERTYAVLLTRVERQAPGHET